DRGWEVRHSEGTGADAAGRDPAVHVAGPADGLRVLAAEAVQPEPAVGDRGRLPLRDHRGLARVVRTRIADPSVLSKPEPNARAEWRASPATRASQHRRSHVRALLRCRGWHLAQGP